MMVAAVSAATNSSDKTTLRPSSPSARPPLLPSEQDQQQPKQRHINVPSKKPRGKQVSSRYLSPSPSSSTTTTSSSTTASSTASSLSSYSSLSRRYPSPLLSRTVNSGSSSPALSPYATLKRSQSVDKRGIGVTGRVSLPMSPNAELKQGNASEISAATKMLITSTRSLSVSFQGEAFSLPISKAKVSASSGNVGKKTTPERRRSATPGRDHGENYKPVDQHRRWPGKVGGGSLNENISLLSRSLDYGEATNSGGGIIGAALVDVKSLNHDDSILVDEERRLSLGLGHVKAKPDANLLADTSFIAGDLTASDSDSVSSGSTAGAAGHDFCGKGKNGARGIGVTARFWQETNSRLRRLQDPSSPLSPSPSRISISSKGLSSKRFSTDTPLLSPRPLASPVRGAARPASPSKLWTSTASSPSRALSSPSRVRPVTGSFDTTPSILSFSADLRRGKIGEERIADAHALRLLYNHYLQWRFVNARADSTFMVQKLGAEKNLWNAWVKISELRHTVTLKRIKLLLVKQKLKLSTILKGQMSHLEEWSLLDGDHLASLEGATEALKASTLRLPIVGKAVANIQDLKESVSSAVDVMHAMASSICSLSKKIEDANNLMAELLSISVNERDLLEQCKEFLSMVADLQVTYCSLRTHIIQVHRSPATLSLTTPV